MCRGDAHCKCHQIMTLGDMPLCLWPTGRAAAGRLCSHVPRQQGRISTPSANESPTPRCVHSRKAGPCRHGGFAPVHTAGRAIELDTFTRDISLSSICCTCPPLRVRNMLIIGVQPAFPLHCRFHLSTGQLAERIYHPAGKLVSWCFTSS